MTVDCAHDDLEIASEASLLSQSGTTWLNMTLSVRCESCGTLFSWRGLNSGTANPNEPVTSADGFELRAPISPQPGGVVGLLKMAGLEDRLKEDPNGHAGDS
jgi:hypothetical protein